MKKYIILLLLLVGITCLSCTVEKQLDDQYQLGFSVKSMNGTDPEPIIALEDGAYSILASYPNGGIVGFSVKHNSDFPGFIDQTQVLVAQDVTVDSQGKFSKPVKTALIKYPIKAEAKAGAILEVQFSFTDTKGNTVSTTSRKKVVNFKSFNSLQFLYKTRPFHSFFTGRSYSTTTISNNETFKDSLHVFWFREDNVQYLTSPNSERTAQEFALRYANVPFQRETMQNSRFIKLDGLELADVDDEVFAAMDFSNALETIEGEHQTVYGVLLQDGRKAALDFQLYLSAYSRVRSRVQVTAD